MPSQDFSANINREFEEREAQKRAVQKNIPYISLEKFPINPDVLQFSNVDQCRSMGAIPFYENGRTLKIAVLDPEAENLKLFVESLEKRGLKIEQNLCSNSSFETGLKLYESDFANKKVVETREDFQENQGQNIENQTHKIAEIQQNLRTWHTEQILTEIQIAGLKLRASDIHFQPNEGGTPVRFRIDGMLHEILVLPNDVAQKIIARIKYTSGMKSNISDRPQDGRYSMEANGRKVDFRVSVLPTEYLESVVLRILDSRKKLMSFVELGFSSKVVTEISEVLKKKNGMVLITGPTGSGKTTTLYSMLSDLNSPDRKIVTLEDPIEYHLENVTQSQVDEKQEYNFATGLRAMLRHDPDVILVGEIRDASTAKLAAEASLTGHIVLSSIHTNSAIGAITRLQNLGLESFNMASAINAIFAQRLVRRLCPNCAEPETFEWEKAPESFQRGVAQLQKSNPGLQIPSQISVAKGCDRCAHTGYRGQTAVCEGLILTPEVKRLMVAEASEREIRDFVREHTDFLSLFDDGVRKVLEGETTLDEIYRVVG